MIRKIIIGILMVIVIALVVFWLQRKVQTTRPLPISVSMPTPPSFPSLAVLQPAYSVTATPPPFPDFLPLYQTAGPAALFLNKFAGLAKNLGVAGDPRVIVISRGNFSVWNNGASSLMFGGDPPEVSYNSGAAASGPLNDTAETLYQAAVNFIQKNGLLSSGVVLSKESIDYFVPKGGLLNPQSSPLGATLAQINFRYQIDNRPVFTRQANTPSLSVVLNSQNQTVSLSGNWLPDIAPGQNIKLLSYRSAANNLTSGRGVLTSLSSVSDFNTESVPQYSVSSISTNKVVLGYYYSPDSQVLTPVYVFGGSGTDNNTGKTVSTITLVSALPQ